MFSQFIGEGGTSVMEVIRQIRVHHNQIKSLGGGGCFVSVYICKVPVEVQLMVARPDFYHIGNCNFFPNFESVGILPP